jgi:hypothetical protein
MPESAISPQSGTKNLASVWMDGGEAARLRGFFPSVVEFLKKTSAMGSAGPGVDLRFCPWLLLFTYRSGESDLSSSLCRHNVYL